LRLNIEIKVLAIISRLITLEDAIKSTKNIETVLKFFQLLSTNIK